MYVEHPYKFNDKFYAKVDGKFYEITREVPLYITKRSEAVLQWGKRKNIKKSMINGKLVIEQIKEKSIKDVVVENICYDQKVAERRYRQNC